MRALHVKKSHGIDLTAVDDVIQESTEPKRRRVRTACDLCRKRKLRCDGESPCQQCRTGNADCQYHSANHPALRRRRNSVQESGREELINGDETEPQDETNYPGVTPVTISTFDDPNFQPELITVPLLGDPLPEDHYGTSEVNSMIPSAVAELDAGMMLGPGDESEIMQNFWNVPLLVRLHGTTPCSGVLIYSRMAKHGGLI